MPLFIRDDPRADDVPNTAEEIIAGFANENAYFVGIDALIRMSIDTARFCLEDSSTPGRKICQRLTDYSWGYSGPSLAALTGAQALVNASNIQLAIAVRAPHMGRPPLIRAALFVAAIISSQTVRAFVEGDGV